MEGKAKILVLCTGNSCRSQLAEGFLRKYLGNKADVYSAGVEKHGVNPRAIQTMQAIGIDISAHSSNLLDEYLNIPFDYVITVCDNANERCPLFPSRAIKLHQNFTDPAKASGTEEEINAAFTAVRDEIADFAKAFVSKYFA